jgi:hypothetical protein
MHNHRGNGASGDQLAQLPQAWSIERRPRHIISQDVTLRDDIAGLLCQGLAGFNLGG